MQAIEHDDGSRSVRLLTRTEVREVLEADPEAEIYDLEGRRVRLVDGEIEADEEDEDPKGVPLVAETQQYVLDDGSVTAYRR